MSSTVCLSDFPDGGGGVGMFDDLTDDGSGCNLMSPPYSIVGPPAQFIRRGSIHSEYDVLPEELGRYVRRERGGGGERGREGIKQQ